MHQHVVHTVSLSTQGWTAFIIEGYSIVEEFVGVLVWMNGTPTLLQQHAQQLLQ